MSLSATPARDGAVAERRGPVAGADDGARTLATVCTARHTYAKRTLDLVLGSLLVIATLPLLLLIGLLIALVDGRPVLYRQERVGARPRRRGRLVEWHERRFRIIKFRTMRPDADSSVHQQFVESFVKGDVEGGDEDGADFKLRNDPRVTRVGSLLRRTSLDELPQLLNVLAGTMSLVGPRPVPPYEVALYEPHQRERLAALPGMTGPWQVHGRGRTSFEEMMQLDIGYVRRASLSDDIRLLMETIPAVLGKRGAR